VFDLGWARLRDVLCRGDLIDVRSQCNGNTRPSGYANGIVPRGTRGMQRARSLLNKGSVGAGRLDALGGACEVRPWGRLGDRPAVFKVCSLLVVPKALGGVLGQCPGGVVAGQSECGEAT
jgi:hypothetical protein